jgi:hypothetical protein
MNSHMCLEIAFRSESSATNFAFEGSFAGMRAIMHLKSTFTTENAMTYYALIGICQLMLYIIN